MCTNLEWLYENDRKSLMAMVAGECDDCKFHSACQNRDCRCDYGWLNAEYVEPYKPPENDNWNRILSDSQRSIYDYCREYLSHLDKKEHNAQSMSLDLVRRCMCLSGIEQKGIIMITNLEWLYANDRDALIEMASTDNCDYCLVDECDGEDSMTYEMCTDFRKRWFKAQYEERDNRNKLTNDIVYWIKKNADSGFEPPVDKWLDRMEAIVMNRIRE